MKKVFFAAMAVAAMMLQSCGNSTNSNQENDSTVVEIPTVEEPGVAEAQEAVGSIAAAIESGKAEDIKTQLEKAWAYVKQLIDEGKAEEAEQYAALIQQFVETNKEKINEIAAGNEAVASLVSTITNTPATVNEAVQAVSDKAEEAANEMKEAAMQKVEEETKKATDAAKEKVGQEVDKAANALKDKLGVQ